VPTIELREHELQDVDESFEVEPVMERKMVTEVFENFSILPQDTPSTKGLTKKAKNSLNSCDVSI
jgi:hypothetical protein